MSRIIIVFSKVEVGKRIQEVLSRYGWEDVKVCGTGAQALQEVNSTGAWLVICGLRLSDMHVTELKRCLPPYTELLLIASRQGIDGCPAGVMAVESPVRGHDLAGTIRMMAAGKQRCQKSKAAKPQPRSPKEQKIIEAAKHLLIERNHLTEEEAHRYLQKQSMDTGRTFAETAQMVQMLFDEE
ncbi:ANTAR domain-containing protein [Lachnospiraceae bacterium 62-35]